MSCTELLSVVLIQPNRHHRGQESAVRGGSSGVVLGPRTSAVLLFLSVLVCL